MQTDTRAEVRVRIVFKIHLKEGMIVELNFRFVLDSSLHCKQMFANFVDHLCELAFGFHRLSVCFSDFYFIYFFSGHYCFFPFIYLRSEMLIFI